MDEQEIRAAALKVSVLTLGIMQPEKREQALNRGGKDIQENIIAAAHSYENYIRRGNTKAT